MEQIRNAIKSKKGTIMLESLIVYTITLFLLFFILAIFSILFQRWNLQTIANETVTRMAQTYRFSTADASSGYVKKDNVVNVGKYRYVTTVFTDNMEKTVDSRIQSYADSRLAKTTYTKNIVNPVCEVLVVPDAMGRRHLELTISGEYSVPFGEALVYFGFPGTTTYEVKAYADCVDIIDYVNFVDYVDRTTSLSDLGSDTLSLLNALFGLIDNIFNS